jgi:hypothetical protein
MPDLEYFVVCRSASVDLDTDELTLSNVLSDVFPEFIPTYLEKAVAVSCWRFQSEDVGTDYQASLRIELPQGGVSDPFPMNLSEHRSSILAMQTVVFIPLDKPGTIIFRVSLNGVEAATHHVTIHPQSDEPATDSGEKESS